MNKPPMIGTVNGHIAGEIRWNCRNFAIRSTTPKSLAIWAECERVPIGEYFIVTTPYGVEGYKVIAQQAGGEISNIRTVR